MVGKTLQNADIGNFGTFIASYRPPSGNLSSDSCRGGPKLRNEYSNIKIGQLLSSEMRKKVRQPQILTFRSRASIIMPMYSITHVSHCPCAPYPCTPYPLYPITPVPHRPHSPCGPLSNGDKGDGAHGTIAYRGMWYRRYRPHGQWGTWAVG